MSWMETLSSWAQQIFHASAATQRRLLLSVAVLVLVWLVQRIVVAVVHRRTEDVRVRYRWKKAMQYIAAVVSVIVNDSVLAHHRIVGVLEGNGLALRPRRGYRVLRAGRPFFE